MPIRTRRYNDPKEPGDGQRILVCRIRPRGVSRENETWDAWMKELGPTRELLDAYHGKHAPPIGWAEYSQRYLAEMEGEKYRIEGLAGMVVEGETITLLCSSACTDPARCHRTLLAELIERAVAAQGRKKGRK